MAGQLPWWLSAETATYKPQDIGTQMTAYNEQADPYYEASAIRMRRAMERSLGSQRRYLGENFASRGLYGAGQYGRAQERLGNEAYGGLESNLGNLQSERMRLAMQRVAGLQDTESQRQYQSWANYLAQLQGYGAQRDEQRAQERAARNQAWSGALKGLGSAAGTLLGGFLPGTGTGAAAGIPAGNEDWYSQYLYA